MSIHYTMTCSNFLGIHALDDALVAIAKRDWEKALIVTDSGLVKCGLIAKITEKMDRNGIKYTIYSEVEPNPTVDQVHKGLEKYKAENCNFIIAIGGGSAMDCAKGINVLTKNEGHVMDYKAGAKEIKGPLAPLVCISTTAGTASEVTSFAVITDTASKTKFIIIDELIMASMTIVDPEVMRDLPPFITACTGMDALTHAIEAFVANGANHATNANALSAIKIIFKSLKRAYDNGHDIQAREDMAYAQFMAGIAFNTAGLGLVHAMAHQIGGSHNLAHGLCNTIILPNVCEFNAKHSPEALKKYAYIARDLFFVGPHTSDEDACAALIDQIRKLQGSLNIPFDFSEYNFTQDDINSWTKKVFQDPCLAGNPYMPNEQDVQGIYQKISSSCNSNVA